MYSTQKTNDACGFLFFKHKTLPHVVPKDAKDKVRDHIKSFPYQQSHNSHADHFKRRYLLEGMTINAMYRLYCGKHDRALISKVVVKVR